ncbi:MAG: SCO family protein [Gallionella sp.]
MYNKLSDTKGRFFQSKLLTLGMVLAMVFGNQSMVNAEEHHEHHDPHEHHKAAAEVKGYASMLTNYSIPEVTLVDSHDKQGLLSETISSTKPVMLNFIFTTCTAICPTMSATFAQVTQQMDVESEGMQLISISVDPEHDTPPKLKEYAKKFEAGSQWQLFTGSVNDSIKVQQAFDAYRGDKMNHIPLTFIRGANAKQWMRIEGLASAEELIYEYRKLATQ